MSELSPEGEETYEGLIQWLTERRRSYGGPEDPRYEAIDWLVQETHQSRIEDFLPWQK